MKKLFLYVLLFVGIFSLCFLLANEYFKQLSSDAEAFTVCTVPRIAFMVMTARMTIMLKLSAHN